MVLSPNRPDVTHCCWHDVKIFKSNYSLNYFLLKTRESLRASRLIRTPCSAVPQHVHCGGNSWKSSQLSTGELYARQPQASL